MNIITVLLSVIFTKILLIEPISSASDNSRTIANENNTLNVPNGVRFQRILQRKKRFLIFPPGASIVVRTTFLMEKSFHCRDTNALFVHCSYFKKIL